MRERYRLNVVGDFYVEAGCCTLCALPGSIAPELFGGFNADGEFTDEAVQCWVKKQPDSATELDAMIEVMESQDLDCIRYCGSDPAVRGRVPKDNLDG